MAKPNHKHEQHNAVTSAAELQMPRGRDHLEGGDTIAILSRRNHCGEALLRGRGRAAHS